MGVFRSRLPALKYLLTDNYNILVLTVTEYTLIPQYSLIELSGKLFGAFNTTKFKYRRSVGNNVPIPSNCIFSENHCVELTPFYGVINLYLYAKNVV